MKRSIRLLLALIATIGILAACTIPALATSDDPIESAGDDDDGAPVYYFSDAAHSSTYEQRLEQDGIDITLHAFTGLGLSYFIDNVSTLLNSGNLNLSGAYVIFELTSALFAGDPLTESLFFTVNEDEEEEPGWLEEVFAQFREMGCAQIMFVCDTDEKLFQTYSDCLDCVDVHVNTDIWYVFISNVFYRILQAVGDPIYGVTFLVDDSYNRSTINHPHNGAEFAKWLLLYLRTVCRGLIGVPTWDDALMLEALNIDILVDAGNSSYYDLVSGTTISVYSDEFSERMGRPAYAIGSTQSGTTYAETWVAQVLRIRDTYDIDLPIYIYNLDWFTCEDYAETDVYCSGGVYNLYAVMYDFASGAEMAPYQNWSGRCDVTHKTLLFGPGGWMQDLSDLLDIEGWGLLMDGEAYNYYYGHMTFWVR